MHEDIKNDRLLTEIRQGEKMSGGRLIASSGIFVLLVYCWSHTAVIKGQNFAGIGAWPKLNRPAYFEGRRPLALRNSSGTFWGWSSPNLRQTIQSAALSNGLDPDLIHAVIFIESGFNPHAVSPKGACGLMQLMPSTARELGVQDRLNPHQNVTGGSRYLKAMLERFNGDLPLALAAYNAGPGAIEKHRGIPPYKETQAYVRNVLKAYQFFKGA